MAQYKDIYDFRKRWYSKIPYKCSYWENFDFTILNKITYRRRPGRGDQATYNDAFIMADFETSKKVGSEHNHIVAFTISIRAFGQNIVTLWGRIPDDFITCLIWIMDSMPGDQTIIYYHNLAYDWVFIRKFLFAEFGYPEKQLNTKSHYPINIQFENGLILKDSLILAQRSLDKWAADLGADHQKVVGKWDYNKKRHQHEIFSPDELEYIEHDTLAGVECLDLLAGQLRKPVGSLPYTATGIPREDVKKLAKKNRGKDLYNRLVMSYDDYRQSECCFHGGFTHANRHELGWINPAICYDFASDYPFQLLAQKFPMERFTPLSDKDPAYILKYMDDYAYMFKLCMVKPHLKNDLLPMPALQYSKCTMIINPVLDNGRVLCADYAEIYLTEQDLYVIMQQYDFASIPVCKEVKCARKDYLPRWLTDYIFKLFQDKTMLKGGDPVLYAIAKAKLNSIYGLHVQKNVRQTMEEDYLTGEYWQLTEDPEEVYNKYISNRGQVLPYQWGVWVTAYAFKAIFDLGTCIADDGIWLYSDTDSAYATKWDPDKIAAYNQKCKDMLQANGYGPVIHNGREYWLGVAELDGEYSEFITCGAKRYACRVSDDKVKITVAGVPKSGAACLDNDLHNFKPGLIFDGQTTGKLTHKYIYVDDIYTDEEGNRTGDSIDLTPCDYLLSSVYTVDWEEIFNEELTIQVYG